MKNKLYSNPVSGGYKRVLTLLVMLLAMTSAAVAKIAIGGLELKEAGTYQCSAGSDFGWGHDNNVDQAEAKVELSYDDIGEPVLKIYNLMVDAKRGFPALEITTCAKVLIYGECRLKATDANALELGAEVIIGSGNSTAFLSLRSNKNGISCTGSIGYQKTLAVHTYISTYNQCIVGTPGHSLSVMDKLELVTKDSVEPVSEKVSLKIGGGYGITEPFGAHFYVGHIWNKAHTEKVKGNVTIDKVKTYGITICGTMVDETNYDCIDAYRFPGAEFLGEGSVTYNPQSNQLSLGDNCHLVNITADRGSGNRASTIKNVSNEGLTIAVNNNVRLAFPEDKGNLYHEEPAIAIDANTEIRGFGLSPRLTTTSSSAPDAGYIKIYRDATLKVSNEMTTGNGLNIETSRIYGYSDYNTIDGKLVLDDNVTIKAIGCPDIETVKYVEVSAPNLYSTPVVSTESAPAFYLKKDNGGSGIYGKDKNFVRGEVILTTKGVQRYDLTVCGQEVNSNNCQYILTPTLKSGRIYYRDDMKWLVLDNVKADMAGSESTFLESQVKGLEVRITGGNEISNLKSYGMEFLDNTTLKGLGNGGSLYLRGSGGGILANEDLTIETNSVSYLMPSIFCFGELVLNTPITLTGFKEGTLRRIGKLTLNGGLTPYDYMTALEVKEIAGEGYTVVGSDGLPFTRPIIFRKSSFDDPHITVGDVKVTEANMKDVLKDGGSVKYSTEGRLTLTNATINGTDYALHTETGMPLEIEVIGNCKLNSTTAGSLADKKNTLSLATNTTFTGTGTLVANQGINVMGSYFIVDGPYVRCNGGDLQGCQGGESMTVKSGKVYARIVQGFKEFTLAEGIAITAPEGAYYDTRGQRTLKADGTVATGVMIATGVPYVAATDVTLNKTALTLTTVGETALLYATVKPSDATNQKVTWSSSNESVATVTNGKVKAVGDGTATITAKVTNGPEATCEVTVNTVVVAQKLSLNKEELVLRIFEGGYAENEKLVPVFEPEGVTNSSVDWSIGEESVATINEYGRVQAVGFGTTTVTCSAKDGSGKTATCTVKVVSDLDASDEFYVDISQSEDEYIGMACHITDRTNKYCEVVSQLYDPEMSMNDPAIDKYTEGDIVIPEEARGYSVTRIGGHAFTECDAITSITLPEGLQTIGFEAFNGCSGVKILYLPSTLVSIDDYAFMGCASLESVFMMATTPPEVGLGGFGGGWWDPSLNPTRTLYVPAASLKLYKEQEWTEWFDKILPIGQVAGDLDGDGEVTADDAKSITDYLLGKAPADFNVNAADFDGDGEVTITDITSIIQSIIEE